MEREQEAKTSQEPSGIDIRAVYDIFMRRRWIALSVLAATLVVGGLYTLRATRIYRATARVFIEDRTPRVLNQVSEVYESAPASTWNIASFYQTQQEIIVSRPIAERVVATLDIDADTLASRIASLESESVSTNHTGDTVADLPEDIRERLELIGFDKTHFASREELVEALRKFDVTGAIQHRVQVVPMKDSRIAIISIDDPSPQRAALFANTVADSYVEYTHDQRFTTNRAAVEWLSKQLTDLRGKLQQSELALHQFRLDNNLVAASMEARQSMVSQTLEQINASLAAVTAQRIEQEARQSQIQRALSSGVPLDGLEGIGSSLLVQELKTKVAELNQDWAEVSARYTPEHPHAVAVSERRAQAQRELDREVNNLYRGGTDKLASVQDNERRLRSEIEQLKTEALELNRKEIDYRRLSREVDNNQQLLEVVLKREKEADLTAGLTFSNVRKFEAALVPDRPVRPLTRVNMAVSLILGLVFAASAAWVVDRLDNTLKTQQQVEQLLAVPFLGIVPSIKITGSAESIDPFARDRFILDNMRSSVAECCRNIRTNLMFMSPHKTSQTIVVTSSGPRDGKSTLAINLAYTLAHSGKRVLLIDTDMRKPRLHRSFKLSNDFGMSNLILGEVSLDEAVQATPVQNLSVLTCGPIPPNPSELLHTEAFNNLCADLSKRYDRVIFDSPPVSAVSDALVLGGHADGVVLVVKSHRTTWPAALHAKRRLERVGCRIYGVVLNDVDLDDSRSGEYQEYYHYYRQGYGDEKPAQT